MQSEENKDRDFLRHKPKSSESQRGFEEVNFNWALPEISEIGAETGDAVRITLDIDKNRVNILSEAGGLMETTLESIQKVFKEEHIRNLNYPLKQRDALLSLKKSVENNKILELTKNSLETFKNMTLVKDLLTPGVYARIEFVFDQLYTRVSSAVPILKKRKLEGSHLVQLKLLRDFQKYIASDVSATINSFASQLITFGAPIEELQHLLDDALKIPGYPTETIRAVSTKKNQPEKLPHYYRYYRDSVWAPETMSEKYNLLKHERENKLTELRIERLEHARKILDNIQNKEKFLNVVRRSFPKLNIVDFEDDMMIDKMLQLGVLEKPDVFGFLVEEEILDKEPVVESLGQIGKISQKITFWERKSVEDMFEDKLKNENFLKLKEGDISFSEIKQLYDKWREVANTAKIK